MIPDEITIGGTVAGVLLSLAMPQLMGARIARAGAGLVARGRGSGVRNAAGSRGRRQD